MRIFYTRRARWGAVVAAIVFIALLALFMLPAAMAATQCGEAGTGLGASGKSITRTAEEAKGLQVRDDGYWWTCAAPRAAPPPPPPAGCPAPSQGFMTWEYNGLTCTTADKYATRSNSPARDGYIPHGGSKSWSQWQGVNRGSMAVRCVDGVRSTIYSFCTVATHCDVLHKERVNGEEYVYDARSRDKKVPIGETVLAVSASGKTIPMRCSKQTKLQRI